jgi:hypothetical protein
MANLTDILLWASAGAGVFAVIGALFGALAGAHARAQGQAPGGGLGNTVARAFGLLGEEDQYKPGTGAVVGAVDGAVFLSVVGFLVGAALGYGDTAFGWEELLVPLRAALVLVIATIVLGALAYFLIWGGQRAVGLFFFILMGVVVGGYLESRFGIDDGLLYGLLGGGFLGLLAALVSGTPTKRHDAAPAEEPGEHPI